jgi:hypothetical protein
LRFGKGGVHIFMMPAEQQSMLPCYSAADIFP